MLLLILQVFLAVTVATVALAYVRFRQKTKYWQHLGVPTPKAITFPFGSTAVFSWETIMAKTNVGEAMESQYEEFCHEPYFGVYGFMGTPMLFINDPELIRRVLVKDFNHFVDRQAQDPFEGAKTLADQIWHRQITGLKGDEWKDMRATLTPIFTSGKLRTMLALIDATSDTLLKQLDESFVNGIEFDAKALCGNYSMNTIASCAFGVDAGPDIGGEEDSSENKYIKYARNLFSNSPSFFLKLLFVLTIPFGRKILNALNITMAKEVETLFFYDVIVQALRHRVQSGEIGKRKDFLDIMLNAIHEDEDKTTKEATTVRDEDNLHSNDQFELDSRLKHSNTSKHKFNEIDLVASALLVLIAGYDTTATTITYCLYELARHQEVQDKLVEEIKSSLPNVGETELDYSSINGMEYLDMVLHETLRLRGPASGLQRLCTKDFKIDDKLTIKAGYEVAIASQGIHHDEKFFPDGKSFNPENFSKSNQSARSSFTFLAFGQGPRNCIGMRFALLEAKVAIIKILSKYKIVATAKTPEIIHPDPTTVLNTPLEKVLLGLETR